MMTIYIICWIRKIFAPRFYFTFYRSKTLKGEFGKQGSMSNISYLQFRVIYVLCLCGLELASIQFIFCKWCWLYYAISLTAVTLKHEYWGRLMIYKLIPTFFFFYIWVSEKCGLMNGLPYTKKFWCWKNLTNFMNRFNSSNLNSSNFYWLSAST